eukprot:Gb_41050 [translate_table: standard]
MDLIANVRSALNTVLPLELEFLDTSRNQTKCTGQVIKVGLIRGLKIALCHSITEISNHGRLLVVANILNSTWNPKHEKIGDLAKEAKRLLTQFNNWSIIQIPRKLNYRADRQANFGVTLGHGELKPQSANPKILGFPGAVFCSYSFWKPERLNIKLIFGTLHSVREKTGLFYVFLDFQRQFLRKVPVVPSSKWLLFLDCSPKWLLNIVRSSEVADRLSRVC